MGIFRKKDRIPKVNPDKINYETEALFEMHIMEGKEGVPEMSTEIAGNAELIVKGLLTWMDRDEGMHTMLNVLADNVMVKRIAAQTGISPEEVAESMRDEKKAEELSKFMAKGGDA
jgi:hypothetical protein